MSTCLGHCPPALPHSPELGPLAAQDPLPTTSFICTVTAELRSVSPFWSSVLPTQCPILSLRPPSSDFISGLLQRSKCKLRQRATLARPSSEERDLYRLHQNRPFTSLPTPEPPPSPPPSAFTYSNESMLQCEGE